MSLLSTAPFPAEGFLDDDNYPTDEGLDYLRCFTGTPAELVALLGEVMDAYGTVTWDGQPDRFDETVNEVRISTGGWSGNEEIIGHLKRSFFWFRYWETSRRGGHFTFHVPPAAWEQPMMEWPPAAAYGEKLRREQAEYEASLAASTSPTGTDDQSEDDQA